MKNEKSKTEAEYRIKGATYHVIVSPTSCFAKMTKGKKIEGTGIIMNFELIFNFQLLPFEKPNIV